MTETTQKERDNIRRLWATTPDKPPNSIVRRAITDADRLAAIERQVRELAAKWRTEARQSFGRGTEYHTQLGQLKQRMASEVDAIIDAPDAGGEA